MPGGFEAVAPGAGTFRAPALSARPTRAWPGAPTAALYRNMTCVKCPLIRPAFSAGVRKLHNWNWDPVSDVRAHGREVRLYVG